MHDRAKACKSVSTGKLFTDIGFKTQFGIKILCSIQFDCGFSFNIEAFKLDGKLKE